MLNDMKEKENELKMFYRKCLANQVSYFKSFKINEKKTKKI